MTRTIRLFLFFEAISFFIAALVHLGVLVQGYEHDGAYLPESIIGAVLLAGFGLTFALPGRSRAIAIVTQGFALMGSLIGLYVGVIGVGPHTVPDFIFHAGIVLALLWGLVVATRGEGTQAGGTRLAAVAVTQVLIRAVGLLQLALGLAFWTGNLRVAVPFHIFSGMLLVVLLLVQVVLTAWGGAPWPLALFAFVWALFVPAFGMTQGAIMTGDLHWIVQVAHLLVGLVAIGVAERLAAAARARLHGGAPHASERMTSGAPHQAAA